MHAGARPVGARVHHHRRRREPGRARHQVSFTPSEQDPIPVDFFSSPSDFYLLFVPQHDGAAAGVLRFQRGQLRPRRARHKEPDPRPLRLAPQPGRRRSQRRLPLDLQQSLEPQARGRLNHLRPALPPSLVFSSSSLSSCREEDEGTEINNWLWEIRACILWSFFINQTRPLTDCPSYVAARWPIVSGLWERAQSARWPWIGFLVERRKVYFYGDKERKDRMQEL